MFLVDVSEDGGLEPREGAIVADVRNVVAMV